MQRSGTEAIRTQIQPSKPKREITYIANRQNTKRTYGQLSEQLFPKGWSLSNRNRTKNNNDTRKVKRHQTLTPKQATENHNKTTAPERPATNHWGPKPALRAQPHPQFLKWHKTFSWPPGSHDNPLKSSMNDHGKQLNHRLFQPCRFCPND